MERDKNISEGWRRLQLVNADMEFFKRQKGSRKDIARKMMIGQISFTKKHSRLELRQ